LQHAVPHAPQLLKSLLVSTHLSLQFVIPAGHEHVPFVHTPPAGHLLVQAPQLLVLLERSMQALPQFVWPGGHSVVHWPPAQTWPVAQVVPHAPQFDGSLLVSTHAPPQRV
jgi:hypothetical protein